jgi:hypothetical protein
MKILRRPWHMHDLVKNVLDVSVNVPKKIRENFPEQPLAVLQFKFGLIHHLKYHKFHFQCKKLKHLLQYHPAEQCRSLGTSCITKRIVAKDTRWWRWWTGGMCSGE